MSERSPQDGKPYYCLTCGLGFNEWGACEELTCELESESVAQDRTVGIRKKLQAENYLPPDGDWKFDEEVAANFDAMLVNSIPGYEDMRRWVDDMLEDHACQLEHPVVVDLGASRGEATARLISRHRHVRLSLIEISEPMLSILHRRYDDNSRVDISNLDLRYEHRNLISYQPTCIVSILTTIFTPIHYRQEIIRSIYDALPPGGIFIWVEKILGDSSFGTDKLNIHYYRFKQLNGYTQEAITRKRLALEFAQVPLASSWCEDVLRQAGFNKVQAFWQSLNFKGWVAQK